MIRTTLPALLVLAGLATPPAMAQPAPTTPPAGAPGPAADPAARAEAARIIESLNMGSLMDQTIQAIRPGLVQQLQQAGRATPQQAEAAVAEVIMPALRAATPQMISGIADIWARHFTTEEMRQMRAFYDTPVGKKSLALMPQMTAETQAMVQRILPQILQETISKNRDALRQRGVQL